MGLTLAKSLANEEKVFAAFRTFETADLEALRSEGGVLAVRLVEQVLHERSMREAYQAELEKARQDAATFKEHVDFYRAQLQKEPTGTARVELEDSLKQYETRLDGARGNIEAVQAVLGIS